MCQHLYVLSNSPLSMMLSVPLNIFIINKDIN